MTTLYVDADVPLFVCSSYGVDEFPADEANNLEECHAFDPRFIEGLIDEWVQNWVGPLTYDDIVMVYSSGNNFRKGLTDTYKAKRGPKPAAFYEMAEYMKMCDDSLYIEGLEADDVIGIMCTEDPTAVAVSIDKDFFTVPMRFYRAGFEDFIHETTQEEADLFWMRQTLTGDSTDGITGIPKVGPVKAKAILPRSEPLPVMWEKVKRAYREKGLTDDEALLNARLTRILRDGDYSVGKGVILWDGC